MKEDPVRTTVADQAAAWFVANREAADGAAGEEFLQWLRNSPMHVEEYLGVTQVARDLMACAPQAQSSIDALVERARAEADSVVRPLDAPAPRGREPQAAHWRLLAAAAAIVAAIGVATLLWQRTAPVPAPVAATELRLQTRHGEQLTRRLSDNSVLHVNTDSDVFVRYDAKERRVTINHGQVNFEVAHDPHRPFEVFAGVAEVIARGTVFDVRFTDESTVVTVAEGRVTVAPALSSGNDGSGSTTKASPPRGAVEVGANQQLHVSATDWQSAPTTVDAQHATAWLRHQIAFENEPLADVAAEFNRYSNSPIQIESGALRTLRISGVFADNDPQAFIAFLRSLDGVRVDVGANTIRVYAQPAHPIPKQQ
jgi:transmembrane sensor